MISDAELVARVKRGDTEAFAPLVERYERSALAIALANLRNLHAAEDVVQKSFVLAFRGIGSLADGSKFGQWLLQIVRRQTIDAARARKLSVAETEQVLVDRASNCEASFAEHEYLLELVGRLPEHERTLVGLRYFDGHGLAEIAAAVGSPIGTVSKQLSRAVARLRGWWVKEDSQ